jgi:hypothetical protein
LGLRPLMKCHVRFQFAALNLADRGSQESNSHCRRLFA